MITGVLLADQKPWDYVKKWSSHGVKIPEFPQGNKITDEENGGVQVSPVRDRNKPES